MININIEILNLDFKNKEEISNHTYLLLKPLAILFFYQNYSSKGYRDSIQDSEQQWNMNLNAEDEGQDGTPGEGWEEAGTEEQYMM